MAELGEKVPEVYSVSHDSRTPNSSTNLVPLAPAGTAEVGINWPSFSPFVKQCCRGQWSFRILGFLLIDGSQRFLDPCFRKR